MGQLFFALILFSYLFSFFSFFFFFFFLFFLFFLFFFFSFFLFSFFLFSFLTLNKHNNLHMIAVTIGCYITKNNNTIQ